MTPSERLSIAKLITRRRRQILVHSIIYYRLNDNIISDQQWSEWALELENLQTQYPDIASESPLAAAFEDFDHPTGENLPLDDPWALNKALYLLMLRDKREGFA